MKKFLIFGLFCTLFLTGCGNKTLTCSGSFTGGSETPDGDAVEFLSHDETIFSFDFSGENIKKITEKSNNILDEVQYVDGVEQALKEELEFLSEAGFTVNIQKGENNVYYEFSAELEDVSNEVLEEFEFYNKSYDELKSYYENEGYTCK